MSKGGGGTKVKASPLENQTAQQLSELNTTVGQPIRAAVMPNALQTLMTQNPYSTELTAPNREAIEGQYDVAKRNIMNSAGGRGGALRQGLVMNQNSRASAVGSAIDQARQQGIERALGLVPAAIPSAQSQMSTATSLSDQDRLRNTQNANMAAQQSSDLFGGLGSVAGSLLPLLFMA